MKIALDHKERRALSIAVLISVLFGFYFLKPFFSTIVIAAIVAYIFYPLKTRIMKRIKSPGLATALTIIAAFLLLIIPMIIVVVLTAFQIESLLKSLPDINAANIGAFGNQANDYINELLRNVPGGRTIDLGQIVDSLQDVAKNVARGLLDILLASAGSIPRIFTNLILFIFLLASFLTSGEKIITMVRGINPLGETITNLYLQKMGDMTKGVVKGQFVIAFCQGLIGAISLAIAGWNEVFFFMLLILSVLSVIPLGSGIVTIPIGLIMILMGDYWQGAMVILVHLIIITNIDNFLRARLVPKQAHLNSALMMLAVFSGIAMFGFLGIVIGPVIMILLLSTINVYLSIHTQEESSNTNT